MIQASGSGITGKDVTTKHLSLKKNQMDDYLFRHKGATLFVVQLYLNSFLCLTSKLSGDIMLAFCHIYYQDGICISKQISLMAQHTNTYKLCLVGDSFIKFESNTSSDRLGKEN